MGGSQAKLLNRDCLFQLAFGQRKKPKSKGWKGWVRAGRGIPNNGTGNVQYTKNRTHAQTSIPCHLNLSYVYSYFSARKENHFDSSKYSLLF